MHFHRLIEQNLPRNQERSKQRSSAPASESVCPAHRPPNRDEDVIVISVRFGHIGLPKPNRYHPDFGSPDQTEAGLYSAVIVPTASLCSVQKN